MTDVLQTEQDRRRHLMQLVMRKVQGWQAIWMTSEHTLPCMAKGRYLAAKEFYDWLADGGDLDKAQEYLDDRKRYWTDEADKVHLHQFAAQLNEMIAKGYESEEDIKKGYPRVYAPGFTITEEERQQLQFLETQHRSGAVEVWHLERFLKKPT